MSDMTFQGRTYPFSTLSVGSWEHLHTGRHGGLHVESIMPKYAELARARVLYGANVGAAVGLSPVQAVPTTTASFALYNNHATKSCVVLMISTHVKVITSGLDFSLIAGISPTAQAAAETKYATSLALAITPGSPSPGGYLTDAVTLAGTPLWLTLADYKGTNGILGASATAWVEGLFIVPPTYALGIDIVSDTGTTPKFAVDVLWAELTMDFD